MFQAPLHTAPAHADVLHACADALAIRAGLTVRNPHPLAGDFLDRPLTAAAVAIATKNGTRTQSDHPAARAVAGFCSDDFQALLVKAYAPVLATRFAAAAQHRAFAARMEVRDFRPAQLPGQIDMGARLPETGEFVELPPFSVSTKDGGFATIRDHAAQLIVSREMIINDQAELVAAMVESAASTAARTEAALVYSALENTETLNDGELVFHADHGNVVAEALSAGSLGKGFAALREQHTVGGAPADLPAAHLVVAADLEFAARKLIHESGIDLTVTGTAYLPTGRWYLLAHAELQPTICYLALRNSEGAVLEQPGTPFKFDGSAMRCRITTGAALVSRIGIVRGGAQ